MTKEEAIRIIETAIAEGEWEYPMDYAAAFEMAIAALREQAEAEKNEPLTVEELREMDGEPVWVKSLGVWGLVDTGLVAIVFTRMGGLDLNIYGGTRRLYRRKLEENNNT